MRSHSSHSWHQTVHLLPSIRLTHTRCAPMFARGVPRCPRGRQRVAVHGDGAEDRQQPAAARRPQRPDGLQHDHRSPPFANQAPGRTFTPVLVWCGVIQDCLALSVYHVVFSIDCNECNFALLENDQHCLALSPCIRFTASCSHLFRFLAFFPCSWTCPLLVSFAVERVGACRHREDH